MGISTLTARWGSATQPFCKAIGGNQRQSRPPFQNQARWRRYSWESAVLFGEVFWEAVQALVGEVQSREGLNDGTMLRSTSNKAALNGTAKRTVMATTGIRAGSL